MNKQNPPKGIEWTRIRVGDETLPGYTWNPTAGCLHGCTWKMPDGSVAECYAKTVAERLAVQAYPEGFEHHYWRPDALLDPGKVLTPAGIFVGSMADLFGHWVPEGQIRQVLGVMDFCDWHIFQTLSKYPIRIPQFNPYPPNVWVGVSLPAGRQMKRKGAERALWTYLNHMTKIEASVRFMSIEPLWFDVAPVLSKYAVEHGYTLPFEWAIIGAASNGPKTYQPEEEWVRRLLYVLDEFGIPVFFKGNLEWDTWRANFPAVTETSLSQGGG
jgi:protein gp37